MSPVGDRVSAPERGADLVPLLTRGPSRQPGEGLPRMVLDTDTFNEIDDQFALVHVLLSPDRVSLEAVYAAPFHNEKSRAPVTGCARATTRSAGSWPWSAMGLLLCTRAPQSG